MHLEKEHMSKGVGKALASAIKDEEVQALFEEMGSIAGVVHSIAFANPKTCLGEEFHTDAVEDIKLSHHISCISLATTPSPRRRTGSGRPISVLAHWGLSSLSYSPQRWRDTSPARRDSHD